MRCFPECDKSGHQEYAYCGQEVYCIVEATHNTPVNWDQDVVFYGEIREVEVPMFQIGATYRSKDVDQIIINEANDNRNPEKRLQEELQ